MPNKYRSNWRRPFAWPPSTWEFTPGLQFAADGITALLFLFVIVTVIGALIAWPILIFRTISAVSNGSFDDVRNILLAVGALLGVPFLIWRTLIASRQTDISRESHYTALFTKAVEQLGADKTVKRREFKQQFQFDETTKKVARDLNKQPIPAIDPAGHPLGEFHSYEVTETNYEVRLGAIYALERIAQDSKRDSWPIYLTLGAYIQNNCSPAKPDSKDQTPDRNTSDIDEAFSVLCRFQKPSTITSYLLFEAIHIPKTYFYDGSLEYMYFSRCTGSFFSITCKFDNIIFSMCTLQQLLVHNAAGIKLQFTNGYVEKLEFKNTHIKDFVLTESTFGYFKFTDSNIHLAHISLNAKDIDIRASTFEEVTFHELVQPAYPRKRIQIEGCTFKNCIFIESDLSMLNLARNTFENCTFDTCNLVGTSGISPENKYENCFRGEDLVSESNTPPSIFDIEVQWSEWKSKSRQVTLSNES